MSALRTIVTRRTRAPFTKRWFCEDCGAQVQGVAAGKLELWGPCLCEGWTATDNPTLAVQVSILMTEGKEMLP
jgi:hypothetical protein